ncbi:MAG: diacylglycerol kinase family lipid kinase [Fimbriimonadaceae bacterium]|nr:diacylglycerol kinase family lipid kinase [Chitinophagales bacterium]
MKAYTMIDKWFVIINPVSGRNKGGKLWHKIKPLLTEGGISFDFAITEYVDHASEITGNAAKAGYTNFLIIGGDGTANDVVNGICNSSIDINLFTIAMLSAGTGNDWVRTIGKCPSLNSIVNSLKQRSTFLHDVGICSYHKNDTIRKRYFINIVGLGFEGHVAKRLFEEKSIFRGTKLQYQIAILRSLFIYKHTQMKITVDGVTTELTTLSIAAGIGKYNGGGLKQLPESKYDDGLLDMTVIGNMSKLKMVISLPKLQSGVHTKMKEVKTFRGKEISIESKPNVFIDADGEYLGTTAIQISIANNKLQILKWRD